MKKIYIASPLGFSEACRDFYYERLLPLVRESGFEVLDPWDTGIGIPSPEAKKDVWKRFNTLVGEKNAEARSGPQKIDSVLSVFL